MNKPELLSPAGDMERLKYAFKYGADAVYLGAEEYGMRAAPKNFSLEQLKDCLLYTSYKEGYIIVADRYTTSNGVHQCSKLPKEQWNDFMDWLYDFEYSKMGIPAPDGVIYLNIDVYKRQVQA